MVEAVLFYLFFTFLFFWWGPGRHFSKDYPGPWYRRFSDRQSSTLTAQVDRVVAVLHQNDQPVAQNMRTGLLYTRVSVLGKNILIFLSLFIVRDLLFFQFLS